jgi:heptosyltransferase-2
MLLVQRSVFAISMGTHLEPVVEHGTLNRARDSAAVEPRHSVVEDRYVFDTDRTGTYNDVSPRSKVDIRNIVVRSPNWIGDFVLSVPAIRDLRNSFGDAVLTVVAHRRVADIVGMVAGVDRVVEFNDDIAGWNLVSLRRFSRSISEDTIDLSVVFPLSFSSALMSYLSGARRRVGYSTELRALLLTDRVSLPADYRKRHLSRSYAQLAQQVGAGRDLSYPRLELPSVCESAEQIMAEQGLGREDRLIGIAPFAAYGPAKRWPMENFLAVAEAVSKEFGAKTLLFGSGTDEAPTAAAPASREYLTDMSGRLKLKEAAYALGKCVCLVSNDTGIAHVAAAVGTPVVSVFGSTSPEWTAPLGKRNRVIYDKQDCSPCFERKCRFGHLRCLQTILPERVLSSIEGILGE